MYQEEYSVLCFTASNTSITNIESYNWIEFTTWVSRNVTFLRYAANIAQKLQKAQTESTEE